MPYTWIAAPVFLDHAGTKIYTVFKNDDADTGITRGYRFGLTPNCRDNGDGTFDVRALDAWAAVVRIFASIPADRFLPPEAQSRRIRAALALAIDTGEIAAIAASDLTEAHDAPGAVVAAAPECSSTWGPSACYLIGPAKALNYADDAAAIAAGAVYVPTWVVVRLMAASELTTWDAQYMAAARAAFFRYTGIRENDCAVRPADTAHARCDCESYGPFASTVPGVLAALGDDCRLLPDADVQRCDQCQRYATDAEAYGALVLRGVADA